MIAIAWGGGGVSVGPNPHFTLASYVLHAQKHCPQAIKKKKKKKELMAFQSSVTSKGIQHIHNICKTERERRGGKKTHTQTHTHTLISPPPTFKVFEEQPYFRYHSNPSSVSLSFSFLCFFSFFFLNPSHPPLLSLVADSKYNCEPLRLALCSSSFGVPQRRGALAQQSLFFLWGVGLVWGQYQGVPNTKDCKNVGRDSSFSSDVGRNALISDRNLGIQHCVHMGNMTLLHLLF